MASALVPLANITLGSTTTSVTFSSIVGTYRDLMLVISNINSSSGYTSIFVRLNSDSGGNYSTVTMQGSGSSTGSYSSSGDTSMGFSDMYSLTTTSAATFITHLMDYSATDKHKTALVRQNFPGSGVEASAYRWANTAAVTSILVTTNGNPGWSAGGTFALYGVSA